MVKALTAAEQAWVDQTFESLTLEEKIGQTFSDHAGRLPIGEFTEDAVSEYLRLYPVGSFFLGGEIIRGAEGTAEQILQKIRLLQRSSRIPLLVSGDLEFGAGAAIRTLTAFPTMMALGAANSEELAYALGKYTALEGRACGFNWALAPSADILLNWLNPVVTTRCLGDDPQRVARLSSAVMRGMQEHQLVACAKHFPGDGVDFRDQHIVTSVNSLSEQEWLDSFGKVYSQLIQEGVWSIMTGHIALPWKEGVTARPVPATVSHKITTQLLRQDLGFAGVILTDALDMGGFIGWNSYENRLIDTFNSGSDVLLWPGIEYMQVMRKAIESGRVTEQRLDDSVRRILELKARTGLFRINQQGEDPEALSLHEGKLAPAMDAEAKAASAAIANRSITLVRNRDNLLPLDPDKVKKVLVVMLNRITDGRVYPDADRFVAKLEERGITVGIADTFEPLTTIRDMVRKEHWDAMIVIYLLPMHGLLNSVRPTGDSAKGIWALQQVENLKPIFVSLATPFLTQDIPFATTLVNAYSASLDTVDRVVRALYGEIPFDGKSPVHLN
ncbi:MAG: hypothetical protein K6T85_04610 [Gorillibacterium sp.]|nr:hypothetical protein [Gorillibacterium sp.]